MTQERREFPRITQPFEARYRPSGDIGASWYTATIVDLSAGGIRIRSAESMAPDSLVELEIQLPSTRERLALRGRIMWYYVQAAGLVEHGIAFIEIERTQQIQIDALVQFLHKSAPGAPPPS